MKGKRLAYLLQEKLSELLKNQQRIQTMKKKLPGIYCPILRDQDRSESCLWKTKWLQKSLQYTVCPALAHWLIKPVFWNFLPKN